MITYQDCDSGDVAVFSDNARIGTIAHASSGYTYVHAGMPLSPGATYLPSLGEVKKRLELDGRYPGAVSIAQGGRA